MEAAVSYQDDKEQERPVWEKLWSSLQRLAAWMQQSVATKCHCQDLDPGPKHKGTPIGKESSATNQYDEPLGPSPRMLTHVTPVHTPAESTTIAKCLGDG